jgi:hypothetical protein
MNNARKVAELEQIRRQEAVARVETTLTEQGNRILAGALAENRHPQLVFNQLVQIEAHQLAALADEWLVLRKEMIARAPELGTTDALETLSSDLQRLLDAFRRDRPKRYQQHYWKLVFASDRLLATPMRMEELSDRALDAIFAQIKTAIRRLELDVATSGNSAVAMQFDHPIIGKIFESIEEALADSDHYREDTKQKFRALLLQVLNFCRDRLDAGRKQMGQRGKYLFLPSATEWDLQADLREWLTGNLNVGEVLTEVSGISSGRADVFVTFGGTRFVIELKKEDGTASRESLRAYLGQTVAYQVTNVRLGFLGVLDLTQSTAPASHLDTNVWVEKVQVPTENVLRHVVVFTVPGNLQVPSSLSTVPVKSTYSPK